MDVGSSRNARSVVSIYADIIQFGDEFGLQAVAELGKTRNASVHEAGLGDLGSFSQRYYARHILGPGTPLALVIAAVKQGLDQSSFANIKCARSLRRVHLVA